VHRGLNRLIDFFSKLASDLAHFAPATLLHTYVNTSPLPAACCFTRT
jgi:hypothetical protein